MTDPDDSPAPHIGPFAHMTDEDLLAAYEGADNDGSSADLMLAEIKRRDLDV